MISGEAVHSIGLALIGFSVLIIAVAVPTFLLTGKRLKKQLEIEYGEERHRSNR